MPKWPTLDYETVANNAAFKKCSNMQSVLFKMTKLSVSGITGSFAGVLLFLLDREPSKINDMFKIKCMLFM